VLWLSWALALRLALALAWSLAWALALAEDIPAWPALSKDIPAWLENMSAWAWERTRT